jgi:hypothetical protein
MALKLCIFVLHYDPNLQTRRGDCIKHFDRIMPFFRLIIFIKVFDIPQIFSKSIDIWLWNYAHLFSIMTLTCRQEDVMFKHFDIIMPLFRLIIFIKVFVILQIFSKSIDIWLWNFAHVFIIMTLTRRQEEVTLWSIWQNYAPFST